MYVRIADNATKFQRLRLRLVIRVWRAVCWEQSMAKGNGA